MLGVKYITKFSVGSGKICQDTLSEESKVQKTHTPVHFSNLIHVCGRKGYCITTPHLQGARYGTK